jgi:group I intron endonuclease
MNMGDIYCLTSPSGKKYVGQCVQILSNGRKWGYLNRFEAHCRDAYNPNKDYCRVLNAAIRKYGRDNIVIELLTECTIDKLDFTENYYIVLLNTLSPNGYNLTTGGSLSRQSDETKEKRSVSMIGKNLGNVYPKKDRFDPADNNLPKYLRHYRDSTGKEGYKVCSHPKLKARSFVSKYETMEIKLEKAIDYLNTTADNK